MFLHPQNLLTTGAENSPKFSANFSFFRGAEEISRTVRLIIAKAIIVHCNLQGKERQSASTIDFLDWISVAAQAFFVSFSMTLCVGILNPKIRVMLSTNVTLKTPFSDSDMNLPYPFKIGRKTCCSATTFYSKSVTYAPYIGNSTVFSFFSTLFHSLFSF